MKTKRIETQRKSFPKFLPKVLGSSFKLIKILGKGAYGKVYWVKDKYGRNYAVKKVKCNRKAKGLDFLNLREVSILKELDHPNIIKLKKWKYFWKGLIKFKLIIRI